jgi:hypothetical protein
MADPVVRDDVYRTYWYFAAERHRIFESRLSDEWIPSTADPILQKHRFCNVFRAADRVSQHLIQHAAYGEPDFNEEDLFLRVVLHRLFCRVSTWELLEERLGRIEASTFSPVTYGEILDEAWRAGSKLYTGAYMLAASASFGHVRKHQNHLALIDAMLRDGVAGRVAAAGSLEAVYVELRKWPLIGPFMAYQLAIDINYSPLTDFSENDFTVPGPGAQRGIAKVFSSLGDLSPADAVHWLVEQQHLVESNLGLVPPTLFGRELHAIDCQNLLCEVDKYSRVAYPELTSNRSTIKQRYICDPAPYRLQFPPEWHLNESVPRAWRNVVNDPAPV